MKKYYLVGGLMTFIIIFNAGYVFHELIAGDFFREKIGAIQRESYIIPIIAVAFIFYTATQAYFLHIFYSYSSVKYGWSITKTALVFGSLVGFFWDGLQGGMIEVATFKMPGEVFWVDSSYHVLEGAVTALLLSFFYRRYVLKNG
jgi:hypothetical protein